jgi:hypothetical protein
VSEEAKINAALDRIGRSEWKAQEPPKAPQSDGFPAVPEGFWQEAEAALGESKKRPKVEGTQERGAHLESLIDQALDKLEEVLDLEVDLLADDPLKLVSIQKDAAIAVINLANKVDENRFRKKSADAITSILQQVVDKEKSLGITISVPAITH